ncbi:MAG: hypothetical protein MI802_11990, partial [Desulfobacterales bacterium]|nr:hypothetical protein [Desulfobacterales bacterium]
MATVCCSPVFATADSDTSKTIASEEVVQNEIQETDTTEADSQANAADAKQVLPEDEAESLDKIESPALQSMSIVTSAPGEDIAESEAFPRPMVTTMQNAAYTGAATASIPILVPPGRAGMQPEISLDYNSYRGNGWIGMGWDIEMGAIKRAVKRGVDYAADRYEVDLGNGALELVSRTDWGNNYYGAKIEGGFTKYYYNTSSGGWEAWGKDGTRYYFGTTSASRQDDPDDSSRVFKWCLDKVVDTNGNYMTLSYTKDRGQIYLSTIDYAGRQGSPAKSPSNSVVFYLEDVRTDIASEFTALFEVVTSKRLKSIKVQSNSGTSRAYALSYKTTTETSRSMLEQVDNYGRDAVLDAAGNLLSGTKYAPVELTYSDDTLSMTTPVLSNYAYGGGWSPPQALIGDFNGDGISDTASFMYESNNWRVNTFIGNGTGSFPQLSSTMDYNNGVGSSPIATVGDFNGD